MRWIILGGSFLAYMFDAVELLLLALALPQIRQDLGLTIGQAGLLATSTLLGIGLSSLVVGYVSDNFGRKKALIGCLAVFGAFTASLSLVTSYEAFLALRFLAGFGLGGLWAVVSAYVVESWPEESRGRAAAFALSSFPVGGIVAAALSGLLLPDWRMMFLVAGAAVLIPIIIVAACFEESGEWARERSQTAQGEVVSVAEIFAPDVRRTTLVSTVVAGLALTGYWGSSTWLPTYLAERGLDPRTVGLFLLLLNLGMFIGYNVSGWIADRLGRRETLVLFLVGVTLTLPMYAVTGDRTLLLLLGPLFAFCLSFAGIFGSYLGELFPTRIRTTGAGFAFNVGRGISAFAPFLLASVAVSVGLSGGLMICAACFGVAGLLTCALPSTRRQQAELAVPA
jgi:MFS family permease